MKIRATSQNFKPFEILEQGDWIDLSVCESISHYETENGKIHYTKGDTVFIDLGFSAELPKNYEAYITPRSSTFKKTGLLLTNSVGIIDESYSGDLDSWKAMFYATQDGVIEIGQRLLQFRIQEKMKKPAFEYVEHLGNDNRGGYGSTN